MASALDSFARRLRDDPFFLASALEEYAASERMDGGELAGRLGITLEQLGPLGLCRCPAGETFAADVHAIADRFGANETALAEAVRRADALRTLRSGGAASALAAARDRPMPGTRDGLNDEGSDPP